MGYWAKVLDNIVVEVIVAEEEFFETFVDSSPGKWIETTKANYAGKGYTYNEEDNDFYPPQPYPSWALDSNDDWQAPVDKPDDGKMYIWNETDTQWDEVPREV